MTAANSRPVDAPQADDAFGEMVWDYYHDALTERPQYRRDDGDRTDAHLDVYFSDPESWPADYRNALTSLDGPVLDAGCGPGKNAIAFQERDTEVFAIDRSPGAIAVARERGVAHAAVMDIRTASVLEDAFESVLVVGKQIAVGNSPSDLQATLDALAAATAPGGRLLADFNTPDRCVDSYLDAHRLDDGIAYRRFRVEYDGLVGPWVDILLLEPAALEAIVEETAWEIVDIVGPAASESDYRVTFERT